MCHKLNYALLILFYTGYLTAAFQARRGGKKCPPYLALKPEVMGTTNLTLCFCSLIFLENWFWADGSTIVTSRPVLAKRQHFFNNVISGSNFVHHRLVFESTSLNTQVKVITLQICSVMLFKLDTGQKMTKFWWRGFGTPQNWKTFPPPENTNFQGLFVNKLESKPIWFKKSFFFKDLSQKKEKREADVFVHHLRVKK